MHRTTVAVKTDQDEAIERERLRCVGVVLAYIGAHRLAGSPRVVAVLESLATELEHPELREC